MTKREILWAVCWPIRATRIGTRRGIRRIRNWQNARVNQRLLEENRCGEDEVLTTLGALEIGQDGVPVRIVVILPGKKEPVIHAATALCHAMSGMDNNVLLELELTGGFADLPGTTPCLKQPFKVWSEPSNWRDEY